MDTEQPVPPPPPPPMPEQPMASAAPMQMIAPNKAGLIVGLVACAFGVLGIVTPIIGLLFVALAAVLILIALIKSIKAKYWPAVGFSVLAVVLVIGGLATSPIFLGMVFGEKVPQVADSGPVAPAAVAPAEAPDTAAPAAPATAAPAPTDYLKVCEQQMRDYAVSNKADPNAYVASNQAYLHQCADYMAKNAAGAKP